jgi:death-on-curing protein
VRTQEPTWIELRDVIAIHGRLLAAHGGATGLRDQALLESALGGPLHHSSFSKDSGILELAAIYTSLVRNHPFVDGNKRTGFVIGILFLELNGFDFRGSEEEAVQNVFALAAGEMDEKAYTVWLRQNSTRGRRR